MAKKSQTIDPPAEFGADWHTYAPRQRAYVKHGEGDTLLVYIVGGSSVNVLDEAEFLQDWAPSAEARPARNVA